MCGYHNIGDKPEGTATQGLSVPITENALGALSAILDDIRVANDQIICERFDSYDAETGPVEFESAETVLVLYRRPKRVTARTAEILKFCCDKIFPHATVECISKSEERTTHCLTILIGRGHVEWIARSMRYSLTSVAYTLSAPSALQIATAKSPIGPRPVISILHPSTGPCMTVWTALPIASCMQATLFGTMSAVRRAFISGMTA